MRTSTRISRGAVLPANGEIVTVALLSPSSLGLGHRAWPRIPDFRGVLGDRAVAGKCSRAGNVQDRRASPAVRVSVEREQLPIGLQVRGQIRQMHVVISMRQQGVA